MPAIHSTEWALNDDWNTTENHLSRHHSVTIQSTERWDFIPCAIQCRKSNCWYVIVFVQGLFLFLQHGLRIFLLRQCSPAQMDVPWIIKKVTHFRPSTFISLSSEDQSWCAFKVNSPVLCVIKNICRQWSNPSIYSWIKNISAINGRFYWLCYGFTFNYAMM